MDKTIVRKIFKALQQHNPNPKIELNFKTTFELLVAVVLSAQSTDKGVNKATEKLFAVANTPEAILKLGEEKLKKYIHSIGFYNVKAKNIIRASDLLIHQFQGKVPNTREALIQLPGVGRKSANVILNTIFGLPVIGVDTHVFRVSNRIGLANAKTVEATEEQLNKIIPDEFKLHAHHWLVLLGRYICTAKKQKCAACPIRQWCVYPEKNV
jgi:endonuclease-3